MTHTNQPGHLSRRDLIKLGIGFSFSTLVPYSYSNDTIGQRTIPVSGEKIPVVGLGTWRVFDAGNSKERRARLLEVLRTLNRNAASVVDSSPMYGSSESVVGDLSQQLNIRPSLFLATKVWTSGKEDGIQQMNQSFNKMKVDKMDLMQVHNLVDVHTHLATLRQWKEQGKIRYIGITHYLPSAYSEMAELIRKEKLDFIQCCYNIATRDAERILLPLAKEKGVAVLINRPFQEGGLFHHVEGRPLPSWAKELEINSWAQFFLKFILANDAVTCIIPGTSNAAHLKENLGAGTGKLVDEKTRNKMAEYFKSI